MEGGTGRAGRVNGGARAARVALSPESRAPRNACIIIMTDADRAAVPLICGAFDLAARAGPAAPAAQTSRPLTFIRFDAALPVVRPFALALNRGFYLVNSRSATERGPGLRPVERVARPVWGVRLAAAAAATAAPPRDEAATPRRSLPPRNLDHVHVLCTHAFIIIGVFITFCGLLIREVLFQQTTTSIVVVSVCVMR